MDETDRLTQEILKRKIINQDLENKNLKNSWWKSILTFLSGAIIATIPVLVANHQNKEQSDKAMKSLEQTVVSFELSLKHLDKRDSILSVHLNNLRKTETSLKADSLSKKVISPTIKKTSKK